MTARPIVSTYDITDSNIVLKEKKDILPLPGVFKSPIRPDIV